MIDLSLSLCLHNMASDTRNRNTTKLIGNFSIHMRLMLYRSDYYFIMYSLSTYGIDENLNIFGYSFLLYYSLNKDYIMTWWIIKDAYYIPQLKGHQIANWQDAEWMPAVGASRMGLGFASAPTTWVLQEWTGHVLALLVRYYYKK